jgi:hypothetical protein
MIDVRKMESLDDIEFVAFLSHVTDLNEVGQRNMCDVARLRGASTHSSPHARETRRPRLRRSSV